MALQPNVFYVDAHIFSRCRFCAEPSEKLLDLSTNHDAMNDCVDMMEVLKIDFVDLASVNMPKAVCEACYQALTAYYHFFIKAKLAQTLLSEFYGCDTSTDSKEGIKSEPVDRYSGNETNDSSMVCDKPLLKISLLRSQMRDASRDIPSTLTNPEVTHTVTEPVSRNKLGGRNVAVESSNKNISSSSRTSVSNIQTFTHSKSILPKQSGTRNSSMKGSEHDHTYLSSDSKHESRVATPSSVTCGSMTVSPLNHQESHKPYQSVNLKSEASCPATVVGPYKFVIKPLVLEIEKNIDVLAPNSGGVPDGAPKEQGESWTSYPWACNHCNVKFDTMEEVRAHSKQLHRMCYGFKCVDCNEQFVAFNSFVEHVRQHRDNLRKYCQYCNERFKSRTACERHALSHWTAGGRICDMCGERCAGAGELATHRKLYKAFALPKKKHNKKPKRVIPARRGQGSEAQLQVKTWIDYEWTCQDCGIRTPDIASLRAHARELHDRCFAMKCVDCLTVTRNFPAFVRHVTAHRPNLKTYCPYCECRFEDLSLRRKHLKDHKTDQNTCDCCGDVFENKPTLLQHLETYVRKRLKGTITIEDKTCPVCCKLFNTRFAMKIHERTHDENRKRDHVCDMCGKAFYTSHMLEYHITTHSEKNVVCKVCQQAFPSAYHLKRHVSSHIANKPFTCDICGKRYRRKSDLATHLKSHSDVKRFKCPVCEKKFRLQSYLKSHALIHTGLRPFSCEHCDKTFTYWPNCDKHMRRMHGVTLAKSKFTPQGKVPVNRNGLPRTLVSDRTTEEWMRETVKSRRGRKPTKQKVMQQACEETISSENATDSVSLLEENSVQSSNDE